MSRLEAFAVVVVSLTLGFWQGAASRDAEIIDRRHTANLDSIEIEALGEEVKQCRKITGDPR